MKRVKYVRIYEDSAGESHFEDVEAALELVDAAPPSPPFYVSAFAPAVRFAFASNPPGWAGDWHPVPRRQIFFCLAGEFEFEVSDGEVRRFAAPGILLESTLLAHGGVCLLARNWGPHRDEPPGRVGLGHPGLVQCSLTEMVAANGLKNRAPAEERIS